MYIIFRDVNIHIIVIIFIFKFVYLDTNDLFCQIFKKLFFLNAMTENLCSHSERIIVRSTYRDNM